MNNIKFVLRKNSVSEPMIRLVYRYDGKKFVYSTGLKSLEKYWNTNSSRVTKNHPNHGFINLRLNRIEESLASVLQDYIEKGSSPTNAQLKFKLKEKLAEFESRKPTEYVEITPYIKHYLDRIKSEGELAKGTIQGFDQLLNRWLDFPLSYGLVFSDLTITILKSFHSYMKEYGYSQSQREKIQRKLLTVLRYAEKVDKIEINEDYKLSYWRVGLPKQNVKVVLSSEEIKKVRDYRFAPGSKLDRVRDRWIIGFATGQRYSDFKNINKENIREFDGRKFIEVVQKKTGKIVSIPLFKDVEKIFEKYEGYPPVYSDQKFNTYIKEVAKKVGLESPVTKIIQYSPQDRSITTHPKYDLITSHICRRSFATNCSLKGLSPKYIMGITGHSKTQTFNDYINIKNTDIPENLPKGDSIF